MQESCTTLENYKTSFKWNILNFKDYLDICNRDEDLRLYSSKFSASLENEEKFHLITIVYYKEEKKKEYVGCFIKWNNCNESITAKFSMSVLNSKNTKSRSQNACTSLCTSTNDWGWSTYLTKKELLDNLEDLLPNGTLTLQCDIIFYYEETTLFASVPECNSSRKPFKALLDNELCTDCTIYVGNETFKVHKAFLIAQSPVFRAMFENEMSEKMNNSAEIADIQPEIFKIFLEFIYTNEVADLNDNNIAELLFAAEKYQIDYLKEICFKKLYTLIKVENAVEILLLAEKYKNEKLAEYVTCFLANGSVDTIKSVLKYVVDNCQLPDSFSLKKKCIRESE